MSEIVNADPAELAKFSELAHRWWDPDSEFKPLHQINPLRLEWIDALVGLKGKRALVSLTLGGQESMFADNGVHGPLDDMLKHLLQGTAEHGGNHTGLGLGKAGATDLQQAQRAQCMAVVGGRL